MELLLVAALLCAWGSGFAACRFSHRQRGIETDDWYTIIPSNPRDFADAP